MHAIEILKQTRALLLRICTESGLSEEQLLFIPEGFRNNILWNLGHLIVTQQILHYQRTGQEMYVSPTLLNQFSRGTSPADWVSTPNMADLIPLLTDLPDKLEADYQAGKLNRFVPFTTSMGVVLSSIEDAISYNNFHEGLHMGVMLSIQKLLPH